jgi:hypothetical protein
VSQIEVLENEPENDFYSPGSPAQNTGGVFDIPEVNLLTPAQLAESIGKADAEIVQDSPVGPQHDVDADGQDDEGAGEENVIEPQLLVLEDAASESEEPSAARQADDSTTSQMVGAQALVSSRLMTLQFCLAM